MNPELLAIIVAKNGADIEAIVSRIGIANLIALMPHIVAILETIKAQTPKAV